MRAMAYVIAVLAAVGIIVGIATLPEKPASDVDQPANLVTTTDSARVMSEPGTLVLSVPTMHCEYACYPKIKKVLEESDSVEAVELAEQKEEGAIDNRAVVVKYDAGFNVDAAIALLGENGFEESDIVQ